MKTEKIKTEYGEIEFFSAKEASFNIETIFPKKRTPEFYLKNNYGYLIIIEGIINSPKGELNKNDFVKIAPKEKFWMENKTDENAKFIAIDIPKIEEGDVVWLE